MSEKQSNKERIKEITAGIEKGIMELFESDRYRNYLTTMSRFHRYSLNNVMLIHAQRPNATLVAGFSKWKNSFGRHVKKGEKGIHRHRSAASWNTSRNPTKSTHGGHSRVDDTGIQYQVGDYTLPRTMPEQLRILFNLAVFSGLRKGEMLALQWSDIDFENSTVSVTKAAAVVDGKQVCKAPKTKNSRREVSIPRFLTDRLHNLMVEQTKNKESLGAYWKGNNWLFTQSDGSMMSYSTPYATFQDAIDRYNADKEPGDQLPHIPFHGLRHTSATLLIAAHQDVRTVSNRLGHAQASTTMNIYAHALKENDRTASNALENMLCKTGA